MSASARIRQSIEPLIVPLMGVGLLHILVGFFILNVLPEVHRKAVAETSSKLVWNAPTDFLFDKTFHLTPPNPKAATKSPVIMEPSAPSAVPAMTLASGPSASTPPAVSKRPEHKPVQVPATVTPAPMKPSEKALANVSQSNRELLPPVANSGLIGPDPKSRTTSSAAPRMNNKPNLAAPIRPELQAPPGPAAASLPPVGPETSPAPVASESSLQGNQKAANKYITLSVILPPGSAPAKPRSNKPVLNLLDIVNLNANERAEQLETGGADMNAVEKALQQAILKEWTAPAAQSVPPSQRRATMEVAILRDGTIADASIKTASGSSLMDASIRQVANRLNRIPATLPSNFPKERYELRVNFQIE
jgi:hypothetical protein